MNWILSTFLCIVLIEFVIRTPLMELIAETSVVGRKALHILSANSVSDHWKERVMLMYARFLFTSSMKLAGYMIACATVIALLVFIFDSFWAGFSKFIVSWIGILFSILMAIVYLKIRKLVV